MHGLHGFWWELCVGAAASLAATSACARTRSFWLEARARSLGRTLALRAARQRRRRSFDGCQTPARVRVLHTARGTRKSDVSPPRVSRRG